VSGFRLLSEEVWVGGIRNIPVVAWKGGAKRLKALLKATIRIVSFVFQESTLCVIDHRRTGRLLF
jgi:hypothetical protein